MQVRYASVHASVHMFEQNLSVQVRPAYTLFFPGGIMPPFDASILAYDAARFINVGCRTYSCALSSGGMGPLRAASPGGMMPPYL